MPRQQKTARATRRRESERFGTRRLEIRNARIKDIPGIAQLVRRVYDDMPAYTHGEIRGQINNFREGCFVALLDEKVVGYCASMQLPEPVVFTPHDWDEISGNGYGSRHDPTGDWLYGYEMCVDPKVRKSLRMLFKEDDLPRNVYYGDGSKIEAWGLCRQN